MVSLSRSFFISSPFHFNNWMPFFILILFFYFFIFSIISFGFAVRLFKCTRMEMEKCGSHTVKMLLLSGWISNSGHLLFFTYSVSYFNSFFIITRVGCLWSLKYQGFKMGKKTAVVYATQRAGHKMDEKRSNLIPFWTRDQRLCYVLIPDLLS